MSVVASVYNPLHATKRMEAAGLSRGQAEAIASEIGDSRDELVTKDYLEIALESALNRQLTRVGVMVSAIVALACTVMGVVLTFK